MRKSTKVVSLALIGILAAAGASFGIAQIVGKGPEVKVQTTPAPCACSRTTAIAGADEPETAPGQLYPRFGITVCQCGALTCVSQIPFATGAANQLACVK